MSKLKKLLWICLLLGMATAVWVVPAQLYPVVALKGVCQNDSSVEWFLLGRARWAWLENIGFSSDRHTKAKRHNLEQLSVRNRYFMKKYEQDWKYRYVSVEIGIEAETLSYGDYRRAVVTAAIPSGN